MTKLILVISIFISGCATKYSRLGNDLSEVRPKLSNPYSFSFLFEGNEYYFAPDHFKQDDRKCYLYLGFKNNKLTYAFSNSVFYWLEKIYSENDSPEVIKRKIIEAVSKEKPTPNRCYELGHGPPPDAGQGVGILILLYPITVPLASYYLVLDQIDKKLLKRVSSSVSLGMAFEKMPIFIKGKWQKRTKGKYSYYEFQERHLKMILYFKNDKLNAWSQLYVK